MEVEKTPYQNQLDDLLAKEKTARMNNEVNESIKLLKQIAQLSFDLREYKSLNEQLLSLTKKRGQPKKAQVEAVQLCMNFIPKIDDLAIKVDLITTLKEVTNKKIYLEVEYARCCLMLVKLKETENEINEAAKILQEVQVETYGSMDRREKLEFILYQMNIMIKKGDYVRLIVISRKINTKNLEDPALHDFKITYYSYLVAYHVHEGNYLDAAKSYQRIWETLHARPELQQTLPKTIEFGFNIEYGNVLENIVVYAAISKHSDARTQLLEFLHGQHGNTLEKYPRLYNLVSSLLLTKLISTNASSYGLDDTLPFRAQTEHSTDHRAAFQQQLIQHNILIVQLYYKRISLVRLAALLRVDEAVAENELCEMINDKLVSCKIDRLDGTINFHRKKQENEFINTWQGDVSKVLALLETTSNLIKREEEKFAKK